MKTLFLSFFVAIIALNALCGTSFSKKDLAFDEQSSSQFARTSGAVSGIQAIIPEIQIPTSANKTRLKKRNASAKAPCAYHSSVKVAQTFAVLEKFYEFFIEQNFSVADNGNPISDEFYRADFSQCRRHILLL